MVFLLTLWVLLLVYFVYHLGTLFNISHYDIEDNKGNYLTPETMLTEISGRIIILYKKGGHWSATLQPATAPHLLPFNPGSLSSPFITPSAQHHSPNITPFTPVMSPFATPPSTSHATPTVSPFPLATVVTPVTTSTISSSFMPPTCGTHSTTLVPSPFATHIPSDALSTTQPIITTHPPSSLPHSTTSVYSHHTRQSSNSPPPSPSRSQFRKTSTPHAPEIREQTLKHPKQDVATVQKPTESEGKREIHDQHSAMLSEKEKENGKISEHPTQATTATDKEPENHEAPSSPNVSSTPRDGFESVNLPAESSFEVLQSPVQELQPIQTSNPSSDLQTSLLLPQALRPPLTPPSESIVDGPPCSPVSVTSNIDIVPSESVEELQQANAVKSEETQSIQGIMATSPNNESPTPIKSLTTGGRQKRAVTRRPTLREIAKRKAAAEAKKMDSPKTPVVHGEHGENITGPNGTSNAGASTPPEDAVVEVVKKAGEDVCCESYVR